MLMVNVIVTKYMLPKCQTYQKIMSPSGVLFQPQSKCTSTRFRSGLRPRPAGGTLLRRSFPPDLLVT